MYQTLACLSPRAQEGDALRVAYCQTTSSSLSTNTLPMCRSWTLYASFHQLDRTGSG